MGLLLEVQLLRRQIEFLEAEELCLLSGLSQSIKPCKREESGKSAESADTVHTAKSSDSNKDHTEEFLQIAKEIDAVMEELAFSSTPLFIQKKWFYYNKVEGNLITCRRTKYFKN